MKKISCILAVFLFVSLVQTKAEEPIGVFANLNTNSIQFINPLTQEVSGSLLKGEIGTYGGNLLDVAITSDGKTAIVSNFGDSALYFIDISGGFEAQPSILGSVTIPFFAEDIAITPNDRFALVTDGGFSSTIAVVDIASMAMIGSKNLGDRDAQAVAVTPDGHTVMVADYWAGAIHTYSLSDHGELAYKETQDVLPSWPANIAISPDGKTMIVVCGYRSSIPIFEIYGDGYLNFKGRLSLPTSAGQSCVISGDSKKAYYSSNSDMTGARINVFNISGPGEVTVEDSIELSIPRGLGHLFGVDTMAIDPSGNYLYVSNPTAFGGVVEITVIDLNTGSEVNQIRANGIPTGIAFSVIK